MQSSGICFFGSGACRDSVLDSGLVLKMTQEQIDEVLCLAIEADNALIKRLQAENEEFKALLTKARQEIIHQCGCYPLYYGKNRQANEVLVAIDAKVKGGGK